jgi:hypothetical protein
MAHYVSNFADYQPLIVKDMIKPSVAAAEGGEEGDMPSSQPLEHINFFKHLEDGKVQPSLSQFNIP